uniref:Ovule protein n=1 Tax=Gongylonema pulchrum TaxID=637853 RepID=A0A183DGZ6_9BILA
LQVVVRHRHQRKRQQRLQVARHPQLVVSQRQQMHERQGQLQWEYKLITLSAHNDHSL